MTRPILPKKNSHHNLVYYIQNNNMWFVIPSPQHLYYQYEQKNINVKPKEKRVRRKRSEIVRDVPCPYDDCDRQYGSRSAMRNHLYIKHGLKSQQSSSKKTIRKLVQSPVIPYFPQLLICSPELLSPISCSDISELLTPITCNDIPDLLEEFTK